MLLLSSSETHGQIVTEGGNTKGKIVGVGGGEGKLKDVV